MKILRLVTVNLLLLFALLTILEIFLEKTQHHDTYNSLPSRYIKLREFALPGQSGKLTPGPLNLFKVRYENLEFKDYKVDVDSLGFIQSVPPPKSNSETNIVFFGGSTTECQFVDDSLRFPSLVGKKFNSAGKSVATYNSGVSGNHTLHSINLLVNKVIHRNFQIAVLMHNINDLVHFLYNSNYYNEENSPTRKNLEVFFNPDYDEHDLSFLREYGFLFRTKKAVQVIFPDIYEKLHFARLKVTENESKAEFDFWGVFQPVGEAQFSQFQNNLETFISICRSNNIEPVLMTQFNRITPEEFKNPIFSYYVEKLSQGPVSAEMFFGYYRRFNDIIRDVAASQKVLLIDLDKEVPKSKEYMYDMVHLNNGGSRFVADVVYGKLNSRIFNPSEN